jgi:tetratricopeptide (TPR) repeat protein
MTKDRVSAMCRALDDQVQAFCQRPLEGAHPYLWLDAKVVKVRDRGHVYPKALVIADQDSRRALELFLELDDRYNAARTYHNLGIVAQRQRRFDEADQHYRRALKVFLELDDHYNAARTCSQVGILLTQTDLPGPAIVFSLHALQILRETLGGWSERDLQWLKRQRRLVGDKAFAQAVATDGNQALAESLASLLEQISEPDDDGSAPTEDRPDSSAR